MSILLDGTQGIDFNDGSNQSTAATPYARKNLIINGDMRIAQRGTSTASITSSGYYTVDRWRLDYGTAGTWTMSQDTDVPTGQGFATSMKWDCTTANGSLSAGSAMIINQRIEGQNLQHLKKGTSNAESVTLSFWVKSNKTGTYIAEIYDNDNTRQISKSYTIASADTWEKKTLTFAGDTTGTLGNDNDTSLLVNLWLVAGTDLTSGTLNTSWASVTAANRAVGQVNLADNTANYINITGCQLEVNDSASDFEFVPYDMELARCQRYYEVVRYTLGSLLTVGQAINSATAIGDLDWTVTKRAVPTLSLTGTVYVWNNISTSFTASYSFYYASVNKVRLDANSVSTSPLVAGYASAYYAADASVSIKIDAEL